MNTNKIHLTLRNLIKMKSARDGVNFTLYRLAKSLNMPHSVLLRLIHLEPTKRVNNPRIDTLYKIVEFFKLDGFNITVNDLLMGFKDPSEITIQDQQSISFNAECKLPLYSFNIAKLDKIGQIQIKLIKQADDLFALQSEEEIKPIFKQGSIFVIDPNAKLENNNLVAVKVEKKLQIMIKKIQIQTNHIVLTNFDNSTAPVILNPQLHSIVGVVIQVNAKT
ncbi:MAG: S24 family peptidase [Gammaproteobacteria bacterium]|nr:MAG: S24 family peptidase [Gammaproteobacteria bacterium]